MSILNEAKEVFIHTCSERCLGLGGDISVRPLSPSEAIGDAEGDFVVKKGKEYVIEATFENARGQAFTGKPCKWDGTLEEILSLDLSEGEMRGVFVAAMNAVLRYLGLAGGTIHCKDTDPSDCGPEIAANLKTRFGQRRYGMVGLQPAILEALAKSFSPQAIRVSDLNPDNISGTKYGIEIWDGATDLARLVEWCEVGLATGSSIVNGSIDEIAKISKRHGKPLVFFGNTISGAAALLSLDRLCPFGR